MALELALAMEEAKFLAKLILILTISTLSSQSGNAATAKPRELRVELNSSLPIDPLYLATMSQYDLSLMLYRAWFDYDNGRRADHGLVKSWKFDNASGCYSFEIEKRTWSDGTPLVADQFIANLKRLIKSDTAYGKSLDAIIDLKTAKTAGEDKFSFCTKDKKPSNTLFNQLGSVFLSLVHPSELDTKGRVQSNTKAIGPYMVSEKKAGETVFKENPGFPRKNLRAPMEVIVRTPSKDFSLDQFLAKKTWANYFQTNTMMPRDQAQKVVESKFPMWSRGFDRVALLRPLGDEKQAAPFRKFLISLGHQMQSSPPISHPLQVARAKSLQPIGYPLFKELKYPSNIKWTGPKEIKIFTIQGPSLPLYQEMITPHLKALGVRVQWMTVAPEDFFAMDWDKRGADLVLFSFGVADPEPSTWLSLVFGSKFISYSAAELSDFEKLLKITDHEKQNAGYLKLLNTIGLEGGYLPLLHGATVSIGHPGINFDLVPKLDETVDYSKIQFE